MNVEKLNDILQIATVVFAVVSAACGTGLYFTGKYIAEALNRQIADLQREQVGRTLSSTEREHMNALLGAMHKTKQPISVSGSQGNVESIKFANLLVGALKQAGFPVTYGGEDFVLGGGAGSGVQIRSAKGALGIGKLIGDAFSKSGVAGVRAWDTPFDYLPEDRIEIIVGYRPLENGAVQ
jgi:hypothetical protein